MQVHLIPGKNCFSYQMGSHVCTPYRSTLITVGESLSQAGSAEPMDIDSGPAGQTDSASLADNREHSSLPATSHTVPTRLHPTASANLDLTQDCPGLPNWTVTASNAASGPLDDANNQSGVAQPPLVPLGQHPQSAPPAPNDSLSNSHGLGVHSTQTVVSPCFPSSNSDAFETTHIAVPSSQGDEESGPSESQRPLDTSQKVPSSPLLLSQDSVSLSAGGAILLSATEIINPTDLTNMVNYTLLASFDHICLCLLTLLCRKPFSIIKQQRHCLSL